MLDLTSRTDCKFISVWKLSLALSTGAKQTAYNQSEQRYVTYTVTGQGGAESVMKQEKHGCLVTDDVKLQLNNYKMCF